MGQLRYRRITVRSLMTKTISRLRESLATSRSVGPTPIKYLTENGYSIVRRCDLEASVSSGGTEHCFVVRDPDDYELEIMVEISNRAFAEIAARSRGRLSLESSYWITCAERHLADYLREHDDYPPAGRLTVDYVTPDEIKLSQRWRETDCSNFTASQSVIDFSSDGHRSKQGLSEFVAQPQKPQPIKLLTENGYSIVRQSDTNSSVTDTADQCRFMVEDPNGDKREVGVRFDENLIREIQHRRLNLPLSLTSKYWLVCAEGQLAMYLWEHDQFPPTGILVISDLGGDGLLMAQHWRDGE